MTRDSDCTQPRSVSCEAPRVFHVHYVNIATARTLGTRALTYDDEKRVLMHQRNERVFGVLDWELCVCVC